LLPWGIAATVQGWLIKAMALIFNQILKKDFVRNTLWELLAKFFTLTVQAIYFVLVTRLLGAETYGSFIGITSLAGIVFPFTSFGSGDLLIQAVARNKKLFSLYWGNGLVIVVAGSFAMTILLFLLSPFIFAQQLNSLAVLMILQADLIGLAIFVISAKAFMSVNLLKKSSLLQMFSSTNKLIAAFILAIAFPQPTLVIWAALYLASAIITAIIGVILVSKLLGTPQPFTAQIPNKLKEGVYFSIGESASNINANIDKTMLASMASLEATGIYGAAYRFIEVGSVPIYAILSASYPKFFQYGASGIKNSLILVKRLLPIVGIYGIVSFWGYIFFAPYIPYILGDDYTEAIAALQWLAFVPLIGALQLLLADTLTGAGFQKIRSTIQVTTAISNALLNLWLIPQYSWLGATWATLASESFRVIFLLVAIVFVYYQQNQQQL
jgi:O-antigen/teichoic acid export membrane protein